MNELPFADTSCDVVTGGHAPGGTAAFLEFSTSPVPRLRTIQLRLLGAWGAFWGWIFHRNPEVYSYIAKSLSYYPDFIGLPRMMTRAGFRRIRQKKLLLGMLALTFAKKGT